MLRSAINRRQHKRLRIDKSVLVPVHVYPILPFIGPAMDASVINVSKGGMALVINFTEPKKNLIRNNKLKVHFRLPGHPLFDCQGIITQSTKLRENTYLIGIRFLKISPAFKDVIETMCIDNDRCDHRIYDLKKPQCELSCSFFHLCRKPIRSSSNATLENELEIALQHVD